MGCRALQGHYGIGALLSVAIWEEMGDCRRFGSSSDAVRHAGLDVTVWASDSKRAQGHLARQGPAILRWALYEAAMSAAKRTSPDHDYYLRVRDPPGPRTGRPLGRPQAQPALLPHPSGTGRRRPGAGRLTQSASPPLAVSPVVDVAARSRAATAAGALVPAGPKEMSGGDPPLWGTPTHHHVTGALSPRTEISLGARRPHGTTSGPSAPFDRS